MCISVQSSINLVIFHNIITANLYRNKDEHDKQYMINVIMCRVRVLFIHPRPAILTFLYRFTLRKSFHGDLMSPETREYT
jgi:hypothetical protein